MDIKIITYHAVLNYGAILQAYALQKYLLNEGESVSIVDFQREEDNRAYSIIRMPHNIKDAVKMVFNVLFYPWLKRRSDRFRAFRTENMNLTGKYCNLEDFNKNKLEADLFITGSDQVWNCSNGLIPEFFLDFDVKSAKRVSYAASIGVDFIPEKHLARMKQCLEKFERISVREEQAKRIIQKDLGLNVDVVCDPVILLRKEAWKSFIQEQSYVKQKYILCYSLLANDEVQRCIDQVKEVYNLPIIIIAGNGYFSLKGNRIIRNAGPIEFLNWIYHAEFVICCSFHGTVFSSVFNKQFISVLDHNKPSRVCEYLSDIGLSDRIYTNKTDVHKLSTIDYKPVNKKIERLRRTGQSYLAEVR